MLLMLPNIGPMELAFLASLVALVGGVCLLLFGAKRYLVKSVLAEFRKQGIGNEAAEKKSPPTA